MKKANLQKRVLSLLLSTGMLVALLPTYGIAAELPPAEQGNQDYTQAVTVDVEYADIERTSAKISYHKTGIDADPVNLIFLVDVAKQGERSHAEFETMMRDYGIDYIYDYGVNSSTQIITYQNTVYDSGALSDKEELLAAFGQHGTPGEGVANEPAALKAAIQAVKEVDNDDPTVVFWVLGEQFGSTDENAVEVQLQALTRELGDDDALITWQLSDNPSDLLTQYATRYKEAHAPEIEIVAAHACSDPALFSDEMRKDLEQVVHDHYHNIDFSLRLTDSQTIVSSVQKGYCESQSGYVDMSATPSADGKGIDVHLEHVCRQVDIDFVLEVALEPDVYMQQIVMDASEIQAPADYSNGGLHTGLFDESTTFGLTLYMPAVSIDRTQSTMTFQSGEAVGAVPQKIQQLVGTAVTIPNGDSLSVLGNSFGGWNVVSGPNQGAHYNAGEVISMPSGNMILEPAWGHVEVELELGNVNPPVTFGNQMADNIKERLDFSFGVTTDSGVKISTADIVSLRVIDQPVQYDKLGNQTKDPYRVKVTNVENAVYARHVGATDNDKVVAYLTPSNSLPEKYELYIAGPGGAIAPADLSGLFQDTAYTSIALTWLDTQNTRDMSSMFSGCIDLIRLDLGDNFDTGNVTNMKGMFFRCMELTHLDLGNKFNTQNVTNMDYMFYRCANLYSLNLEGNFNTAAVSSMYAMFSGCAGLTNLSLGENFNTENVTNMAHLFSGCESLQSLDLGENFDTRNVTDMDSMFYRCVSLQSLDLKENFSTAAVTNMHAMFSNCESLMRLELDENFDTANVTNMGAMFSGCHMLNDLIFSKNFLTTNATDMSQMFSECWTLNGIDLSGFDTAKVTNMNAMFYRCWALETLDLSRFDTAQVTDIGAMFSDCTGLTQLDVSTFDTARVTNLNAVFFNCSSLTSLTLGDKFDISSVAQMSSAFANCSSLETIDGALRFGANSPLIALEDTFENCRALERVIFETPQSGTRFERLSTMKGLFSQCNFLQSVDLSGWSLPNLTNVNQMFSGCSGIQTIDMSWRGLRAKASDFSQIAMFDGVPQDAVLEIGSDTSENSQEVLSAIAAKFPGSVTVNGEVTEFESEQIADVPEIPQEPEQQPTVPEIPQEPEQAPVEETANLDGSVSSRAAMPDSLHSVGVSLASNLSDDPDSSTAAKQQNQHHIVIHHEPTPAGSHFTYRIRVKYVGDTGAQSGRIELSFPLPEAVKQIENTEIIVSDVEYSDNSAAGFRGGRVVTTPHVDMDQEGNPILHGSFEGLYTGNEIEIEITCINQEKKPESDGYIYWAGIAHAQDSMASASSDVYLLWDKANDDPDPPDFSKKHTITYAFVGEVPHDVDVPTGGAYTFEDTVYTASAPVSKYTYYHFDGWVRSDTGGKVGPDETFSMPNEDLTLIGIWKVDSDQVPKVTVQYKYTHDNHEHHVPIGAPDTSKMGADVMVGHTHSIVQISEHVNHHIFGGWTPTLTIGGQNVPLSDHDNDSEYTGAHNGSTYTVNASGWLQTEQFRNTSGEVVVSYHGAWRPYTGTIRFNANGGNGVMNAMRDVTWDAKDQYLPKNEFTYPVDGYTFIGWATSPSGKVVKKDGALADGLIDQNGKTVTLYAVWKHTSFEVGYALTHVTSSNMEKTIDLGDSYESILVPDPGYEMKNVSITMGGAELSADPSIYHPDTGKVSIIGVSGNIIIRATAEARTETEKHTIVVSVTGGTASPSGTVQVENGKNQTITFSPNIGYELKSVTVDGTLASLNGNSYTFTNVTDDHSIAVVYEKDNSGSGGGDATTDKYPIYVETAGNGTADSNKDKAASGETVTITTEGVVESITATADKTGKEIKLDDKCNGKYTFKMPSSAVTVKVRFEQTPEIPSVADPDSTGVSSMLKTKEHMAYMLGYETGDFGPANNITRAEVAQAFYRLLLDQGRSQSPSFPDVAADAWYHEAVVTLAAKGIITGYEDGTFQPEQPITRSEFAAIAARFAKASTDKDPAFPDVPADAWYRGAVQTAVSYGWINGYEDGTFRPEQPIGRAETAAIINRMLARIADRSAVDNGAGTRFPDVPASHWAFYDVAEASTEHAYTRDSNTDEESWSK